MLSCLNRFLFPHFCDTLEYNSEGSETIFLTVRFLDLKPLYKPYHALVR